MKVEDLKKDKVTITIGSLENPESTRTIAVELKEGWQKDLQKAIKSLNLT